MSSRFVSPVLEQDKEFIKSVEVFDYTRAMGQYALEIRYTNGDNQVFTTPSTNPNHFGTHEFETKEDLMNYYKTIKPN